MSDLLNKKNKNSLNSSKKNIIPEQTFDRQKLFTSKDIKETPKKDNSTGTRIDKDVLKNLKALKTLDNAGSISEVIQSMIYLREKNMTDDERRQYELIKSIF